MAFKCNTANTDPWTSTLNTTTEDGTITIETEDSKGRFKGKHKKGQEQAIKGKCHGDGIWFLLPAVRPQFLYSGTFTGDNHITGFRINLGADAAAAADDDWVATRPPTFAGQSEPETSSKKRQPRR